MRMKAEKPDTTPPYIPASLDRRRDRGRIFERYTPQAPAAGAEWAQVISQLPGFFTRLVMVQYVFTASAAVANRAPRLQLSVLGRPVLTVASATLAVTAGLTQNMTYAVGLTGSTMTAYACAQNGLPSEVMFDADVLLGTNTTLIDAADTYTGIVIDIERVSF